MLRTSACAVAANSFATTTSVGSGISAPRARLLEQFARHVEHVGFVQRSADVDAGGRQESVRDAAADDELVDLRQQGFEHGEFGRYFRTGNDGDQRTRRLGQGALERFEFADQQRTRAGNLGEFADAMGRRLGAMRGAERVHHEHVAQPRHLLCEVILVLLLALVEAHVLEQHRGARQAVDAGQPVLLERHRLA
jgi:hypothetical protein